MEAQAGPTWSTVLSSVIAHPLSQQQLDDNHIALMTDIKTIGRDQSKLGSFSRYLVDTILKPSES
ncbi:hypothetical protein ColLi_08844 [Colletotrichum liriopes]|uniref:Uncharacterized protein n=1 Tax=Colletotrichum liriopes TaxID=708192 RepID=A0AA37LVR2_9PEZI|nr:hypothetical protein ColLi_08844 [Colletotrichum liriopes]